MPVEFKDYYATLGVAADASEDDIRKAFRKLARVHHPDVAKDKKASEEKFKEINEAYEVLSDPQKRREYDDLSARWKAGGGFESHPGWQSRAGRGRGGGHYEFHFGGTGFSDFFEQFFGRGSESEFSSGEGDFEEGRFRQARRPVRGGDVEGDILVTLEEMMNGAVRTISLQRVNPRTGESETENLKVRIPAGVEEGQLIRIAGKGQEGIAGGAAGDLFLRVRVAAHPDFRIRGSDLYHDLDLAPWEAVLGSEVGVPTLSGSIKLRVPAGTNHCAQLRVRGQGLPKGKSGKRGDLYVVVNVQLPERLTDEERALWEKLRSVSHFNPRRPGA
jgi:curved DNA-binding protein